MKDPSLDSGIDIKSAPREHFGDWYHRFVRMPVAGLDLLSEQPSGRLTMDLARFDEVVPA